MRIALIACSKTKQSGKHKAQELYTSLLFRLAWGYVSQHFDKIFILSAKYGLLDPEKYVKDYDLTLNTMSIDERRNWSARVAKQIRQEVGADDELHFFCGKRYREFTAMSFREQTCLYPLKGLGIGRQLQWYKNRLQSRR